jgi:diketogulonate reductase-like aldo/keto reductase
LAKNIGVSNFRIADLERILKIAKHKPVVNQIELHPYLQQNKLRQFHAENDILTEAYAPLAPLTSKKDGPLTAVIEKIAEKEGKTPAQVHLSFRGLIVGIVEMVVAKECYSCDYQCE